MRQSAMVQILNNHFADLEKNELLFAVFNGENEFTQDAYQEVLNFAAFIQTRLDQQRKDSN